MDMIDQVLSYYYKNAELCIVNPITTGLINVTYEVRVGVNRFILQEINTTIFFKPELIISNMLLISNFLNEKQYPKNLLKIKPNLYGQYLTYSDGKTWRMTEFISDSRGYNKVVSKEQAFNAAKALSEFHFYLNDFPIDRIAPSIEGFLDFEKRINDFDESIKNSNENRLLEAKDLITYIQNHINLVERYLSIKFPQRIVHADAKIGNFLFDENDKNKVLALIDWDTILPGNILCDFGDMVRTYANLTEEDDADASNLFSKDNYEALKEGFLYDLETILSEEEKQAIDLTAQVVILIQAVRFLTDFLNNDVYYSIDHEYHNLNRTINQINLLKGLNQYLCIN